MALAVVQSTKQFGVGVTSVTTPAISTTSGNLAVVDVSYYQPSNAFSSISDSVGLTWAESIAELIQADGGSLARQRYAQITTGNASHTFTYNASSNDYPTMAVKEISGAATSSPLAETNTGNDTGQTSHSLSLTTSTTADKILCAFGACYLNGSIPFTQTGSFTKNQEDGAVSDHLYLLSSSLIVSATGTYTYSFTSPIAENMLIGIAAFKMAVTAAASPMPGKTISQAVGRGAFY